MSEKSECARPHSCTASVGLIWWAAVVYRWDPCSPMFSTPYTSPAFHIWTCLALWASFGIGISSIPSYVYSYWRLTSIETPFTPQWPCELGHARAPCWAPYLCCGMGGLKDFKLQCPGNSPRQKYQLEGEGPQDISTHSEFSQGYSDPLNPF